LFLVSLFRILLTGSLYHFRSEMKVRPFLLTSI
jgi:hypothetical protein